MRERARAHAENRLEEYARKDIFGNTFIFHFSFFDALVYYRIYITRVLLYVCAQCVRVLKKKKKLYAIYIYI